MCQVRSLRALFACRLSGHPFRWPQSTLHLQECTTCLSRICRSPCKQCIQMYQNNVMRAVYLIMEGLRDCM